MYRNVVVPLDGSDLAEQVLPYVKDLIQHRTLTVHLVSVAPLPSAMPTSAAPMRLYPLVMTQADLDVQSGERERIEDELRNYLKGVALTVGREQIRTRVEVRFGDPAEEVIAYAREVEADLIAMCTHGRTGLARWAYGSVTEKVMRHAHCPVLLVRARRERAA